MAADAPGDQHPYYGELKGAGYELFILLLSILSVCNLVVVAVTDGAPREVALLMELLITPIFVTDFLYRLATARSRRAYFVRGWGWADLLGALPMLRVLRVFRVVRVGRLIRQRGRVGLLTELAASRAQATFLLTMFLVVLVLEVAGTAIFYTEAGVPGANIENAGDAVWWGLVTITTVGYGDQYPVSSGGRIVGAFLLFAGIALFSVLTGFIANSFLAPRRRRRWVRPGSVAEQFDEVRRLLDEQEERAAEIRRRLDELEGTSARERTQDR